MENKDLAKRLKELRDKSGWLQKDVADKLNVRSNTLSGYESGTRSPDPDMIVKLAELYQVSTDYLLGHKNYDVDKSDAVLFEYYRSKIITEFPDVDLMFKDMASLTGEDLKEIYDYIKFKMSQREEDD